MNNKVNIDADTLKFLYTKYKEFLVPVMVMIVSIILLIVFVVPQFLIFLSNIDTMKTENSKLSVLKNNLNIITSANDSILDSQLKITSAALPLTKDYTGILNALATSSRISGASLGTFEFQVGDVSQTQQNQSGFPFLKMTLNVGGDMKTINNFINSLSQTLPLSEITGVIINNDFSTINLSFYYKPVPANAISNNLPINAVSKEGFNLISKLSSFSNSSVSLPLYNASPSSRTNPF
ncbi:MAG: hypothetical protein Q7R31_00725 [Candidatus Levybacteria bacterium]|nr:hypothetical protein [Candidatus Levybacteria bacterium]